MVPEFAPRDGGVSVGTLDTSCPSVPHLAPTLRYVAPVFATSLIIVLLFGAVVIGAFAVLIVVLMRHRQDQLRRRAAEAAQFGWFPVPPNPWLMEVAARLFQRGRPGEMFAGDFRGRGLCVLEYTYTTSSGSNGQTQNHTVHVVALNLPVALPPLTLTKDSGLKRMFGGRDLELESKAFNDAFRISCADERYASAVLHPRMMEWMLFNRGLEWQFAGNALVSWGRGSFTVRDVLARLEAMTGLIDRIPPYVLRDYGQVS